MKIKTNSVRLRRFLELATINFSMNQILIDVTKNGLFTSAIPEDLDSCWSMIADTGIQTTGTGPFVINTDDIQKVLSLMRSDRDYNLIAEENELKISGSSQTTVALPSVEDHINSDEHTSYVPPRENGKRLRMPLKKKAGVFIPELPPQAGKSGTWEQIIEIDPKELKERLKAMKALKTNLVTFSTTKSEDSIDIIVKNDEIFHRDSITHDGKNKIDWEQQFGDPIQTVINMIGDTCHLVMTKYNLPHTDPITDEVTDSDINCGLYIYTTAEDLSAAFSLSPYIEME